MRRRSEFISMGVSITIAALLLSQVIPQQTVPVPDTPDVVLPVRDEEPRQLSLSDISLPPPPQEPTTRRPAKETQIAVMTPTTPLEPARTVTPLQPAPAPNSAAQTPRPAIDPLQSTANSNPRKDNPLPIEPLTPTKAPEPKTAEEPEALEKPKPPEPVASKPDSRAPSTPAESPPPPETAPDPKTIGITDTTPLMSSGRPLLRLLEHGKGPSIDIAWPDAPREREELFRSFVRCYGMLVALMAPTGDLYSDETTGGPWQFNRDRYSGFVRQSGGLGTPGERAWSRRIMRHHPAAAGSVTIRIFPRPLDALLIGGLSRLLGPSYRSARSIGARYIRSGNAVLIDDIVVDGRSIDGRIELTAAASRTCGSSRPSKGV